MEEKVEIEFAHHHKDFKPGDRAEVSPAEAQTFVNSGYANFVSKAAARAAGQPAGRTKSSIKPLGEK